MQMTKYSSSATSNTPGATNQTFLNEQLNQNSKLFTQHHLVMVMQLDYFKYLFQNGIQLSFF